MLVILWCPGVHWGNLSFLCFISERAVFKIYWAVIKIYWAVLWLYLAVISQNATTRLNFCADITAWDTEWDTAHNSDTRQPQPLRSPWHGHQATCQTAQRRPTKRPSGTAAKSAWSACNHFPFLSKLKSMFHRETKSGNELFELVELFELFELFKLFELFD